MARTNAELLVEANAAGFEARVLLQEAYKAGLEGPVPAHTFTTIRMRLTAAVCAVQELENRAIGYEPPKQG